MKSISLIKHRAAALTAAILLGTPSLHAGFISLLRGDKPDPEPSYQRVAFIGSAEVKDVQGHAQRLDGIDRWRPLKSGEKLLPGDLIRSVDGSVLLRMTESQSYIRLTPRTILRLVSLRENWDRGTLSGCEEASGFVVRSCRGKASFKDSDGAWKPVAVNAVLCQGVILRTEPSAVVDLYSTEQKQAWRITGAHEVNLSASELDRSRTGRKSLLASHASH